MHVIRTYHHHNGRVGVIAEFNVETDFAARSEAFRAFMDNVCMALAACELYGSDSVSVRLEPADLQLTAGVGHGIMCAHDDGLNLGAYVEQTAKQFREMIRIDRAEVWFGSVP